MMGILTSACPTDVDTVPAPAPPANNSWTGTCLAAGPSRLVTRPRRTLAASFTPVLMAACVLQIRKLCGHLQRVAAVACLPLVVLLDKSRGASDCDVRSLT
jgi:hypothetical protein